MNKLKLNVLPDPFLFISALVTQNSCSTLLYSSINFTETISVFLAVQDSSIGDLVTQSLIQSCFDFSNFTVHCRAVVDTSRH